MAVAALVAWIATAAGGLLMLGLWLGWRGSAQHRGGRSRFNPALIFSQFGLAAAGLAIWIGALASDTDSLRWVSAALLPVVAGLGLAMFLKWLGSAAPTGPEWARSAQFGRTHVGLRHLSNTSENPVSAAADWAERSSHLDDGGA
ncbi:MAG TPA: hypothetical protein VM262_06980 [Acidimicrobiales bacterium]|nr:hypothetical protein [Acidimicrobiales bacterium]